MANSVTKADLVAHIATEAGLKKVEAERALKATTNAIQSALMGGKKVTLVGFGTFQVSHRAERMGRVPQTKKPIKIPATKTVGFKPAPVLKKGL